MLGNRKNRSVFWLFLLLAACNQGGGHEDDTIYDPVCEASAPRPVGCPEGYYATNEGQLGYCDCEKIQEGDDDDIDRVCNESDCADDEVALNSGEFGTCHCVSLLYKAWLAIPSPAESFCQANGAAFGCDLLRNSPASTDWIIEFHDDAQGRMEIRLLELSSEYSEDDQHRQATVLAEFEWNRNSAPVSPNDFKMSFEILPPDVESGKMAVIIEGHANPALSEFRPTRFHLEWSDRWGGNGLDVPLSPWTLHLPEYYDEEMDNAYLAESRGWVPLEDADWVGRGYLIGDVRSGECVWNDGYCGMEAQFWTTALPFGIAMEQYFYRRTPPFIVRGEPLGPDCPTNPEKCPSSLEMGGEAWPTEFHGGNRIHIALNNRGIRAHPDLLTWLYNLVRLDCAVAPSSDELQDCSVEMFINAGLSTDLCNSYPEVCDTEGLLFIRYQGLSAKPFDFPTSEN